MSEHHIPYADIKAWLEDYRARCRTPRREARAWSDEDTKRVREARKKHLKRVLKSAEQKRAYQRAWYARNKDTLPCLVKRKAAPAPAPAPAPERRIGETYEEVLGVPPAPAPKKRGRPVTKPETASVDEIKHLRGLF